MKDRRHVVLEERPDKGKQDNIAQIIWETEREVRWQASERLHKGIGEGKEWKDARDRLIKGIKEIEKTVGRLPSADHAYACAGPEVGIVWKTDRMHVELSYYKELGFLSMECVAHDKTGRMVFRNEVEGVWVPGEEPVPHDLVKYFSEKKNEDKVLDEAKVKYWDGQDE